MINILNLHRSPIPSTFVAQFGPEIEVEFVFEPILKNQFRDEFPFLNMFRFKTFDPFSDKILL
jgi:hypothetical protein